MGGEAENRWVTALGDRVEFLGSANCGYYHVHDKSIYSHHASLDMRILIATAAFSLLALNAQAGWYGFGGTAWKEEVQLSDKRIIVVEREMPTARGGDEWAINRSGSRPKEYRIRFEYPAGSGKMIEWVSIKKSPQTWPEIPLIFDIKAAQPMVFSLVAISSGCEVYSKYVYRNGVWIEETLPEKLEQQTTNLLFGSQRDLPSLLNLEEKHKRNGEIYRKALKQVGPARKVCG